MTLTCTNVTLRQKPLRNDRISLYLDYYPAIRNPYTMKMSRREFLGIYIYAKPKNEQQRMFNQDMLNKAEAIRCIRVQSLINEEFGFLDKNKQKVDFLAYFRTKAREKYEKWDLRLQPLREICRRQMYLLAMSPWNCARSSRIICSNANRSIIPMLISHVIRQPAIIQLSEHYWK